MIDGRLCPVAMGESDAAVYRISIELAIVSRRGSREGGGMEGEDEQGEGAMEKGGGRKMKRRERKRGKRGMTTDTSILIERLLAIVR
jgi:hypothetical protein